MIFLSCTYYTKIQNYNALPEDWKNESVIILSDSVEFMLSDSMKNYRLLEKNVTWYSIQNESNQELRNISIYFNSSLENKPTVNVTVFNPDGSQKTMTSAGDGNTISLNDAGAYRYNLYVHATPVYAIQFRLSKYKKGTIIRVEKKREYFRPYFVNVELIKRDYNVLDKFIRIDFPEELSGKWDMENPENIIFSQNKSNVDNRSVACFTARNIQAIREINYTKTPEKSFSALHFSIPAKLGKELTWHTAGVSYLQSFPVQKSTSTSLSLLAKSLQGEDNKKSILNVYNYVRNNIRYYGIWDKRYSLVPHQPAEVVKNGYGDCKDMAYLMVSLLKKIGIQAGLALVSTPGHFQAMEKYPNLGSFNHAITWVKESDGYSFYDATYKYGSVNNSWYYLLGQKTLIIDSAYSHYDTIKNNSSYYDSITTETIFKDIAGTQRFEVIGTIKLYGNSALQWYTDIMSNPNQNRNFLYKQKIESLFNENAEQITDATLSDSFVSISYIARSVNLIRNSLNDEINIYKPKIYSHDNYFINTVYYGQRSFEPFSQHDTWIFPKSIKNNVHLIKTYDNKVCNGKWRVNDKKIERFYTQRNISLSISDSSEVVKHLRERNQFEKNSINF
jgi:hypothetical protein